MLILCLSYQVIRLSWTTASFFCVCKITEWLCSGPIWLASVKCTGYEEIHEGERDTDSRSKPSAKPSNKFPSRKDPWTCLVVLGSVQEEPAQHAEVCRNLMDSTQRLQGDIIFRSSLPALRSEEPLNGLYVLIKEDPIFVKITWYDIGKL